MVPTVCSYAVDILPPVCFEDELDRVIFQLDWVIFQLDWVIFLAHCTFDGGLVQNKWTVYYFPIWRWNPVYWVSILIPFRHKRLAEIPRSWNIINHDILGTTPTQRYQIDHKSHNESDHKLCMWRPHDFSIQPDKITPPRLRFQTSCLHTCPHDLVTQFSQ